jgi:hypothetical protein
MTILQPGASAPGLVARIRNILLRPKPEWEVIEGEPTGVGALFTGYAVPLAAVPAVCQAIGAIVFGYGIPGLVTVRPSPVSAVGHAVVAYVLSLVGVFVLSLVVNALAPTFGGLKDQRQATKVVVYASTATWLAGVVFLIPALGILSLVGLYSLYLMYLGLPRLMKAPPEKAGGYLAVTIVCAVVIYLVVGALAATAFSLGGVGPLGVARSDATISGRVDVPGAGSVDLGKLQAAAAGMEAQARQAQAQAQAQAAGGSAGSTTVSVPGAVTPISADVLRGLIPASAAGYPRTEISSSSGGVAGLSAASATAKYVRGEATIDLTVTDMGSMAGLGALAGAFDIHADKQTATGYEKTGRVDGRMTTEEWDNASKDGKYSVMVSDRYMVAAEGHDADMADLKSAVAAILPAAASLPRAR